MSQFADFTDIQFQAHALSMLVNTLFRESYEEDSSSEECYHLLEAYKSLRRVLPKDAKTGQHKGHSESHNTGFKKEDRLHLNGFE